MNTGIQRYMTTHQSFDAHSACNLRSTQQYLSVNKRQDRNCLHQVRSVDERQSFLRLKIQWSQSHPLQRFYASRMLTLQYNFTFTYQCQSEMCKWSQVATSSYRSTRGNNRVNPGI